MEAYQTVRKQMISLLSDEELTSLDISQLVHIPEKDVADHLFHTNYCAHNACSGQPTSANQS